MSSLACAQERCNANLAAVESFVNSHKGFNMLAESKEICSNTSVCLTLDLDKKQLAYVSRATQRRVPRPVARPWVCTPVGQLADPPPSPYVLLLPSVPSRRFWRRSVWRSTLAATATHPLACACGAAPL